MTTKIRVSKKKKTVSKGVAHRKKLSRFGEAKPENANHNISMVSVEQIFLEKRTPLLTSSHNPNSGKGSQRRVGDLVGPLLSAVSEPHSARIKTRGLRALRVHKPPVFCRLLPLGLLWATWARSPSSIRSAAVSSIRKDVRGAIIPPAGCSRGRRETNGSVVLGEKADTGGTMHTRRLSLRDSAAILDARRR